MANKKIRELLQDDTRGVSGGETMFSRGEHQSMGCNTLFLDTTFPPDKSSLTYVYSGDDKYDRMVFRRPYEITPYPCLTGYGGVCEISVPVGRWNGRHWLLFAMAIVTTNPGFSDKLLPGYRSFAQNFLHGYTGAFTFALWRFGEWVEIIVDDYLPMLDNELAFCPAVGRLGEFWAPLLEKAYAKCNKAYEAIEAGNVLNALTDFTGAICEHYSPDQNMHQDLFHILYKGSTNRSLIVAFRNTRSFRQSDFRPWFKSSKKDDLRGHRDLEDLTTNTKWDFKNQPLFVVSSVTKFPMRDGRMMEMLRLKGADDSNAIWGGEFALSHERSWIPVNPTFMANYRPRDCLEPNEFWISFLEFRRHFGHVVICSSATPYIGWDGDIERTSSPDTSIANVTNDVTIKAAPERGNFVTSSENSRFLQPPSFGRATNKRGSIEISVKESKSTIKLNTIEDIEVKHESEDSRTSLIIRKSRSAEAVSIETGHSPSDTSSGHVDSNPQHFSGRQELLNPHPPKTSIPKMASVRSQPFPSVRCEIDYSSTDTSEPIKPCTTSGGEDGRLGRTTCVTSRLSIVSAGSNASSGSDSESTYSASEVKIKLKCAPNTNNIKNEGDRPGSAPLISRACSVHAGSRKASIFESRMDYFRPKGSWKELVTYFGHWSNAANSCGGPPSEMDVHTKNPRISFALTKPDAVNEITPQRLHGKCHVMVSLMQDYRRGARTTNNMLVNIGFCLYKSKNPDKDEKKHLSSLHLISDVRSEVDSREITRRFDLDLGHYLLVPYTYQSGQEGKYLVRILSEKYQLTSKTGCTIS